MLHTLAVLPAWQLSAAIYYTGAILFRGRGRNIYRAGDFYDVVISPTGDSVSAGGDIWRGANLLRDTGAAAATACSERIPFLRTRVGVGSAKRVFVSGDLDL